MWSTNSHVVLRTRPVVLWCHVPAMSLFDVMCQPFRPVVSCARSVVLWCHVLALSFCDVMCPPCLSVMLCASPGVLIDIWCIPSLHCFRYFSLFVNIELAVFGISLQLYNSFSEYSWTHLSHYTLSLILQLDNIVLANHCFLNNFILTNDLLRNILSQICLQIWPR